MTCLVVLAIGLMAAGNIVLLLNKGHAHLLPFAPGFPIMEKWKLFQFQASYADLGFVRRGLVGTILNTDPSTAMTPAVMFGALVPTLGLAAWLLVLLVRRATPLTALAVAVSPAMFWHLGYDLGRFDHLTALMLLAIVRVRSGWVLILMPLMPLVHEATLVTHVPLAIALTVINSGRVGKALVAAATATLLTDLALFFFGANPGADVLAGVYPHADPGAFMVLSRDMADNIALAFGHLAKLQTDQWFGMMLGLALLVPIARTMRVQDAASLSRAGHLALVLACLTPLGLSAVGLDIWRWIALAYQNFVIAALVLARDRPLDMPRTSRRWAMASGLLGPIGIKLPWPALVLLRRALIG